LSGTSTVLGGKKNLRPTPEWKGATSAPGVPRTVLFVESTSERVGGGQQSFLLHLRYLDRKRFRPLVVFPGRGPMVEETVGRDFATSIIPMETIRTLRFDRFFRTVRELRRLMRKERVGIVHANSSRAALFGGVAALGLGIPLVWHVRIALRDRLLDPPLLALASRVIAISDAVAKRFPPASRRRKVVVIPNGIDAEKFSAAGGEAFRREHGLENKFLIGIVGQIVPVKGHIYLLRALEPVARRHPESHCLIVGHDSPYRKELQSGIARMGLSKKVTFVGYREDVARVISSLDLLALPSLTEAFGRVLIEAMACRVPVAAFSVDAVPDVVQDGVTGILVRKGDVAGLSRAILTLIEDPERGREMGRRGRERVERFFNIEKITRKIETVYEEVLR